jgi:Protein of unknown function (DUF3046)
MLGHPGTGDRAHDYYGGDTAGWHALGVRESEFWELVDGEFGRAQGRNLAREHVLFELRNRTAEQALADGVPVRDVWMALCDALDVPPAHRWGKEEPPAKRRRSRS